MVQNMEKVFKDYLFSKHILVSEVGSDANAFETLFTIANMFNIRIKEGQALAEREMIEYISSMIGVNVPEPFYKGFPESVRKLSRDKLLFDQLMHYVTTYGLGDFSEAGHSLFEEQLERSAFKENAEIKDFIILSVNDANNKLKEFVDDIFLSSRPLNDVQYGMVKAYVTKFKYYPAKCVSKNLAIRLCGDCKDIGFAFYLKLSDVLKIVEDLNYRVYEKTDIRNLSLKNQDRKFISAVLDYMFFASQEHDKLQIESKYDIINCYERKALWSGLLHHIHYKPQNRYAMDFVHKMRGWENHSVYSDFEKAMAAGNIMDAVRVLVKGKGSGALLRNLDYVISRCNTDEEIEEVLDNLSSTNIMILIQLLIRYSSDNEIKTNRTFTFTKFEKLKVHTEDNKEFARRKTFLTHGQTKTLRLFIENQLKKVLKNRLGKVYIDPNMKNYALPVQETTSSGGLGILAKGTRLHIDDFKKIRAFTYWEKVDDIDLSCFGFTDYGKRIEFSWRTMASNQSDAIVYSGDQTSGYNGGSEYFDINLEEFKKMYPDVKYVIFCNNVYSPVKFCDCFCKAGYMLRDIKDTGKVFEPKTVASSYIINSDSTFAYLFGLDLENNDFVWLNMNRNSYGAVAGDSSLAFLLDYFNVKDVINLYSFFEMMASELVDNPADADVVVSDTVSESDIKEECKLIRSYDFEKMTAYMG